ncbi:MAG: HmuY family protein [Balneolaceae bacterium]
MKHTKSVFTLFILAVSLLISACSDSSTGVDDTSEPTLETQQVEELHAPADRTDPDASPFVYFNIRTGEKVSADLADTDQWDIAFRSTDVMINSGDSGPGVAGAVMLDVPFDEVTIAPQNGYNEDSTDAPAIADWYTYTAMSEPAHAIIPHEDKTIVLKTADGNHYAKIQIQNYYQGNPTYEEEDFVDYVAREEAYPAQYYTFRYAIQLSESVRELE